MLRLSQDRIPTDTMQFGSTPSIRPDFRADRQIFLYIISSSKPVPGIKPIRNMMYFAVYHRHIVRPSLPMNFSTLVLPVDFCVVKQAGIALYSLRERDTAPRRSVPRPTNRALFVHR